MLILMRRTNEKIVIGHGQQLWVTGPFGALIPIDPIEVMPTWCRAGKVGLGVAADPRVAVDREELCGRAAAP